MLTIFYDGNCPLCATEMAHLKKHDQNNVISLVDIHQNDFAAIYPSVSFDAAMIILHGHYNGQLLLGLAVTHRA
ncbi:MAG: putative DCC family thiol-disulfide oxidoreductase YuxK, partial [Psychroserpens sp.]